MSITLRKNKLKDNRISLYLDYYSKNQPRKKEVLELYLKGNPRTKKEREENKATLNLAEHIRSKRLLLLQHEKHNFSHLIAQQKNTDTDIVSYFRTVLNKNKLKSTSSVWNSSLYQITSFCKGDIVSLKSIDPEWIKSYKHYLLEEAICINENRGYIARNSAQHYFEKLKFCFKQAVKDKLISENPFSDIKGISKEETFKEFLTVEELQQIAKSPCKNDLYKRAFLFGCSTGMRWGDIKKLKRRDIRYSKTEGYSIFFHQEKTNGLDNLPIPDHAIDLLDNETNIEGLAFNGLVYTKFLNPILTDWIQKAGIEKTITFHCSRHTYATVQLTLGTDIYTVSKLLGHADLSTTQIYAKVINKTKIEAVSRMPKLEVA